MGGVEDVGCDEGADTGDVDGIADAVGGADGSAMGATDGGVEDVGEPDGSNVGLPDGALEDVGTSEGPSVGVTDGDWEGVVDGSFVGTVVSEGAIDVFDGAEEGAFELVGTTDAVGSPEGARDGIAVVGISVVGARVGADEGARVAVG